MKESKPLRQIEKAILRAFHFQTSLEWGLTKVEFIQDGVKGLLGILYHNGKAILIKKVSNGSVIFNLSDTPNKTIALRVRLFGIEVVRRQGVYYYNQQELVKGKWYKKIL